MMDFGLILNVCMQLCNGLDYMHSLDIFHRDIKPGNVLIMIIISKKKKNNLNNGISGVFGDLAQGFKIVENSKYLKLKFLDF